MKKILVIDDEAAIRSLLALILEREGFFVMTASDGKEGMKIVKREPVDLVITDLIMPEKEGTETIMELKREFPDIKIIAISGGGKNKPERYLNVAKFLGASHIFAKPLDWPALIKAVRDLLK